MRRTAFGALLGAGVAAAVLAILLFAHVPRARAAALERERAAISGVARALAEELAADLGTPEALRARVRAAGRVAGARLTVVGEVDHVLAESEPIDERSMDDHGHRAEVEEARATGRSRSRRFSRTLGREMEYAAERIGSTRGVVRAARPAEEVDARVAEAASLPVGVALAALLAGALAGALLGRRRDRALSALREDIRAFPAPGRALSSTGVPPSLADVVAAWQQTAERAGGALAGHESENARLESLLHGMPEAMLAVDRDERVQFVNAAARAMLRVPEGETVEDKPLHLFVREPRVLHVVRGALRDGEPGEAEVAWGEAPPRLVRFHAAPVRGGGPGAFLLARDISALRRLERMRSDFVANVSHELRTPIAAIAGAAETLAEGALSDAEAGPRFVDTVRRQAERLRVLVDDLLTLSRLESAPETIERVPVDLASVVRQACEAMAARAKESGVALAPDANGPVRVLGDPEALRRLVDNLVLNAVTYTGPGGRVSARLRAEGGRALLDVVDTGIGIAPEHLDRIFERFYRVDKARSRAKGGTGLGLAIVKHAVNLHGGEIRVESRLGEGSAFRVAIPLSPDAAREGG